MEREKKTLKLVEGRERRKLDQSEVKDTEPTWTPPRGGVCVSNNSIASNVAPRRDLCRRGNLTSTPGGNNRPHVLVCPRCGPAAARRYKQGVNDSRLICSITVGLATQQWRPQFVQKPRVPHNPAGNTGLLQTVPKWITLLSLNAAHRWSVSPLPPGGSVHLSSHQHSGQGWGGRQGGPELRLSHRKVGTRPHRRWASTLRLKVDSGGSMKQRRVLIFCFVLVPGRSLDELLSSQ